MSMLAEPKRKQKWSLNPRGKEWSDDQNKFGQRMLEKMGWSKGKGLGANEQGTTEHVRVKVKNDAAGVGFDKNQMDHAWTEHQDSFNSFLQQLQETEEPEIVQIAEKTDSLSGKSLELKSKQSRARVHYQKFTRGKDVNKYSTKDLANIFGQKDLNEKLAKKEIQEECEIVSEHVGSRTYESGVITIHGGSMADYFKNKSGYVGQSNKENVDQHNSSDDEGVQYRGFGFSENQNAAGNDISNSRTVEKEASNYAYDNPLLSGNCKLWNNANNASEKTTGNVLQLSKKRKNEFTSESTDLGLNSSEKTNVSKKLKISAQQDCLNGGFVNGALDLESQVDETHNGKEFEIARLRLNDTNEELNSVGENRSGQAVTVANDQGPCTAESSKKKKKKAKTKEHCSGAFENTALDLQSKGKENHIGKEFEVPRVHLGITNEALDLTDESNKKKRVTFNDQVEYSTDCNKKKKLKAKLDKFEVGNEKIKKKRKREHDEVPKPVGIVNEALDIEIISEEINDNEVNERKSKKIKKKKERRMSNLETIEEAPEEDRQTPTEDPPQIDVITLDQSSTNVADDVADSAASSSEKKIKKKKKEKTKESITVIDITGDEEEKMKDSKKKKKKHDKKPDNESTGIEVSESLEISDVKNEENAESTTPKKDRKRKHLEEKTDPNKMDVIDKEVKLKKKSKEAKNDDIQVIVDQVESKDLSGKNDTSDEPDVTPNTSKKNKKRSKSRAEITKENSSTEAESSIKVTPTATPVKNGRAEDTSLTEHSRGKSDSLVIHSSWNGRMRMPKKMLKVLFHRKSILQFPGSNIHEIKGYGADVEGTEVPCT